MFCPKCGTQIPDGAAFCASCGAAAEAPTPVSQPDISNQETVAFTPIPEPAAEYPQNFSNQPTTYIPTQPVYQTTPVSYEPERKSGNGGRVAVIVTICVLIVALLTTLVILLWPAITGEVEDIDSGSSRREPHSSSKTDPTDEDKAPATIVESNPYYIDYISADTYVLSASNSKYYSRSELSGLTRQQLYLAERELFARYGGTFTDGDLAEFFNAKSWYTPDSPAENFNESRFTEFERVNLLLLRAMLMERDGTGASNPYIKINNNVEGFILPFTDNSRITKEDVKDLTEKELIIAYSEIYARKGYIFDDNDLQVYFSGKNWYTPSTLPGSFNTEIDLSEIERENYSCLQLCQQKVQGVRFSSGNKYKDCYNSYMEYLCPESDVSRINPYTLSHMNEDELMVARNEIFARHGYCFNGDLLREYFMNCSWYYPTIVSTKLELVDLSDIEEKNVKMIQAFELNIKLMNNDANPNTKMTYYAKHDFMTMYLPEHWRDNCICVKPTGLSGNLEFFEKYNYEEGYGWLFSMELVPTDEGLPNYSGMIVEEYGRVTTPDGTEFYVLFVMPSYPRIEFLHEVYDLMNSQIDTIKNSIEWKPGYTFTPS